MEETKILSFGEQTVVGMPVEEALFIPENTQQVTTNMRQPAITFARGDVDRQLPAFQNYGQVYFNPPLKNPLRSVAAIYNLLYEKIYNYQRDHLRSWFSLHPQLILLKESELLATSPIKAQMTGDVGPNSTVLTVDGYIGVVTPGLDVSDDWLRNNCKLLCSRLAERIALYDDAITMLACSWANLIIAGKFEGTDGYFKDIATDFKWTSLNNKSKNVKVFPMPDGLQEYVIGNSSYLTGVDANGNPILVMPLWATDIWGNRGFHSVNPFSQIAPNFGATATSSDPTLLGVNGELERNIAEQITQYIASGYYDMRMPFIENGATLRVKQGANAEAQVRLGMYGPFEEKSMSKGLNGGHFSIAIWNNFQSWNDYISRNFSDFADVSGDWYKLITSSDLLGGYKLTDDLYRTWFQPINSGNQFKSLEDFYEHAKFGKSRRTTRSTILKMSLIDYNGSGLDPTDNYMSVGTKDNGFIERNFERFKVHETDVKDVLERARKWPTFSPVVSTARVGDQSSFFVGNMPPAPAKVTGYTAASTRYGRSGLAYAERALYDFTRLQSINNYDDKIVTMGITSESSKQLVSGDEDTKIFEENRFYICNDYLPLIDDSDPYACGVNLFVTANPGLRESLYAKIIKSPTNYLPAQTPISVNDIFKVPIGAFVEAGDFIPFPTLTNCPMDEAYDAEKSKDNGDWGGILEGVLTPSYADKAHIANSAYMAERKYALVYVGANILTDPVRACLDVNASIDAFYMDIATGVVRLNSAKPYFTLDEDSPFANLWTAMRMSVLPNYAGPSNSNRMVLDMISYLINTSTSNTSNNVSVVYLPDTCGRISINRETKPFTNTRSPSEVFKLGSLQSSSQMVVTRYAIGNPVFAVYQWKAGTRVSRGWTNYDTEYDMAAIQRSLWGISHYEVRSFMYDDMNMVVQGSIYPSLTVCPAEDEILRMYSEVEVKNMGQANFGFFWDATPQAVNRYNALDFATEAVIPELFGVVTPAPVREKILKQHRLYSPRSGDRKIRFKNASSKSTSSDIGSNDRNTSSSRDAESSSSGKTSFKRGKKRRGGKRGNGGFKRSDAKSASTDKTPVKGDDYVVETQTPKERYDATKPDQSSIDVGKDIMDKSSKRAKSGYSNAT